MLQPNSGTVCICPGAGSNTSDTPSASMLITRPADVQDNHDSKLAVLHAGQPELNAHVDLWDDDAA
jgi:hypothetical protein